MARINQSFNAFTGGELTPKLKGRFDTALYNSSCEKLENFIAVTQGGIEKRQGTRYIATAGDIDNEVRLIPFEFSETEAYVLEFGENYIRFFTDGGAVLDGGSPYEIATVYTGADLAALKYVQAADTYYITHPDYTPQKLVRNAPTDWTINDVGFVNGPFLDENEDVDHKLTPTATSGTITISGTKDTFNTEQVGAFWRLDSTDSVSATVSGSNSFTSPLVLDEGEKLNYIVAGIDSSSATWSGTVTLQKSINEGTDWNDIYITDNNLIIEVEEVDTDNVWYRAGFKAGEEGDQEAAVTLENLNAWGYVEIDSYIDAQQVTATVKKQLPSIDATYKWREGAWSEYRGYPSTVAFFEQRLLFAGSEFEPQDIWGSRVDDYENFSLGALDDDSYNFTLVANAQNKILWMLENRVLHAGTLGGEWQFGYANQPTTPSNVNAKSFTSDGSANIQSVVINNNVLFIQKNGKVLRTKAYDFDIDGYVSQNISLKAEHLFTDTIVDMVFQNDTTPILWMASANGDLIGLTYQPTQQVVAFHNHTTDGLFESLAVIPGDDREELWCVVKRTIDGSETRYIEQFQSTNWTDNKDAYFSDCSIPFDGVPTTTFSGANHLEGEEVSVLADGAVRPNVTISGGAFTLDLEATEVIIGLPYDAVMQTMPQNAPIETGSSFGKHKRDFKISLNLYETIGIKVGSEEGNVDIIPFRDSSMMMNEPVDLFSGIKQIETPKGFDITQAIALVSDQPLPCTILNISTVFYGSSV